MLHGVGVNVIGFLGLLYLLPELQVIPSCSSLKLLRQPRNFLCRALGILRVYHQLVPCERSRPWNGQPIPFRHRPRPKSVIQSLRLKSPRLDNPPPKRQSIDQGHLDLRFRGDDKAGGFHCYGWAAGPSGTRKKANRRVAAVAVLRGSRRFTLRSGSWRPFLRDFVRFVIRRT